MSQSKGVAVAIGAGDGIGAAFARRFANAGYSVVIGRRHPERAGSLIEDISAAGGSARAVAMDARSEDSVESLFDTAEGELGPVEVCLYNAGANSRFPITETTAEMYRKIWELGCFGGFLTGRAAARRMLDRGRGTILFTGATASLRGGAGFAAFAGAKFGLRALAQSMARELGPAGIHVAHLIIDGAIDSAVIRERFRTRGEDPDALPPDRLVDTAAIAETYWALHTQPRSAWTHELELRAHEEPW